MARAIGRTRSWLWWVAGATCALLFGGLARAGELVQAAARYGVRPRPEPVQPGPVTEEQKQQAGRLVDDFLSGRTGVEVTDEEKRRIAAIIVDFGADDYAAREAASREILTYGAKALQQLGEALKHSDPEVAQRAEAAAGAIRRNGGGGGTVEALRRLGPAAVQVISERRTSLKTAAYKAELQAIALRSQKRDDEASARLVEKAEADRKVAELERLLGLVGPVAVPPVKRVVPQPAYGVRIMRMNVE